MRGLHAGRWLQQRQLVLLLLCSALLSQCCWCYTGKETEDGYSNERATGLGTQVESDAHASLDTETAVPTALPSKSQDVSAALPSAYSGAQAAPFAVNLEQKLKHSSRIQFGAFHRPLGLLLVVAYLASIYFFYHLEAKKSAGGEPAQTAEERKEALLAAQAEDAAAQLMNREEALIKKAQEELQELQRQEEEAKKTLKQILGQQQKEVAREPSGTAQPTGTPLGIETEQAGLTEGTAAPSVDHIYDESSPEEKSPPGVATKDKEAETRLQLAMKVKSEQLSRLQTSLEETRKDVEGMQAHVDNLRTLKEKFQILEKQVLETQAKAEAKELELSKEFKETKQEKQLVQAQLQAAMNELLVLRKQTLAVLHAKHELQFFQKYLRDVSLKAGPKARKEQTDAELLSSLMPEESELLEAQQKTLKLKLENELLSAQKAILNDAQEKAELFKAFHNVIKAKMAWAEGIASGTTSDTESGSEPSPTCQAVVEAEEAVSSARLRLHKKKENIKNIQNRLTELQREIQAAEQKLQRCSRKSENFEFICGLRIHLPMSFGLAKSEEIKKTIARMDLLLQHLHGEAESLSFGESEDIFSEDQSVTNFEQLKKDFVEGFERFCKATNAFRSAEAQARDLLRELRMTENLHSLQFEALRAAAAEGPKNHQQKECVQNEWNRLQGELEKMKEAEIRLKNTLMKLETALETFEQTEPQEKHSGKELSALALAIRQKYLLEHYSAEIARLEAKTLKDVRTQVQTCFTKAVIQAEKRRTLFGTDPSVLNAIQQSHLDALSFQEAQIKEAMQKATITEDQYAPEILLMEESSVQQKPEGTADDSEESSEQQEPQESAED